MELKKIINALKEKKVAGNTDIEISSITQDSRKVKDGSVFVAIKGIGSDGNTYIENAVSRGAKVIVSECDFEEQSDICKIIVPDARDALGDMLNAFYDNPSDKLTLIGVTGTNGKTTVTYVINSILKVAGKSSGIIGTISYKTGEHEVSSGHTTPDTETFYALLNEMVQSGVKYAAIEVSSHAIKQKRIRGTKFDVAVFTNLTHDHLDYHKTMEEYSLTKMRLFTEHLKENGTAVINIDDDSSEKFLKCNAEKIITYGFSRGSNVMAFNIFPSMEGTSMSILTGQGIIECNAKLIGIYNAYNIMAAVGVALALDISMDDIDEGIGQMEPVPGRFEYVEGGQPFPVVVDYAHTPDSLKNVLETIKVIFRGNIITVFGATGDRDKTKRPVMGKIASDYSDYIFITSDDPHSEDPNVIADEVAKGIPDNKKDMFEIIVDREKAIKKAVEKAGVSDLILIAGKGHEKKQIFKDREIDFSDREIALKYLKEKVVDCFDLGQLYNPPCCGE